MSEMKYCQGPKCHTYTTKDRIRGVKGDKHYETRKNSRGFYNDEFCSVERCMYDWINKHIDHALNHFGRLHEPKRIAADSAWYKHYVWDRNHTGDGSRYNHYFVNDLLGQRIPITEQQYDDTNLITPPTS